MTTLVVQSTVFLAMAFLLGTVCSLAVYVYAEAKEEKKKLEKWRREQEWEDENSYH